MLKRLQVAEEDLNAARDLIQQLTSTVSQKEKEIETEIAELKTQHEKELSRLGQENYVLQSKVVYHLASHYYTAGEILLRKMKLMLFYIIIESLRLEETSKIIKSNRQPNTTMPTKPCPEVPVSTRFLNISRDGDSTTSLGSLFQCLTILSVKKFFLVSNLNLP